MVLSSAQAARHAAQLILSEGRFHSTSVPDPLHGALVWLGRAVSDPVKAFGSLIDRLGVDFPGGVTGLWAAVAALLVVVTGVMVLRRARTRLSGSQTGATIARPLASDLDRAADQAERESRWREAVQLRFRSGLLRLGESEGVLGAETTPNRTLARRLGSEPLAQLAERFDQIVYGGAAASAADAEEQRRLWPEVAARSKR